MTHISAHLG